MRRHLSASVVIGFSVIVSQPAAIARTRWSSCVPSTVVTMTASGLLSAIILSKSAARYVRGALRPASVACLRASSSRPGFRSHAATSSAYGACDFWMAFRYMYARDPTPTIA